MDSKDGTMDYDATLERGGGLYSRRAIRWTSASGPVSHATTYTPDPNEMHLEPDPDWKVSWGKDRYGWKTPMTGDWGEIRRRLTQDTRMFDRPATCRVLIADKVGGTYWFPIVSAAPGYHHQNKWHLGNHSTVYDRADQAADNLRAHRSHAWQKWKILVLANNRTQVRRWIERVTESSNLIHNPGFSVALHTTDPQRKEPNEMDYEDFGYLANSTADGLRELANARLDRATEEAARLQAKAEFLDSLPDEPVFEDDEPTVVWFTKQFDEGGRVYTYAAVRTPNGFWFTTGPEGGGTARYWQSLVKWIYTYRSGKIRPDAEIWVGTVWERG